MASCSVEPTQSGVITPAPKVIGRICADEHDRIVHYRPEGCPLCVALAELDDATSKLDSVMDEIGSLRDRVAELDAAEADDE